METKRESNAVGVAWKLRRIYGIGLYYFIIFIACFKWKHENPINLAWFTSLHSSSIKTKPPSTQISFSLSLSHFLSLSYSAFLVLIRIFLLPCLCVSSIFFNKALFDSVLESLSPSLSLYISPLLLSSVSNLPNPLCLSNSELWEREKRTKTIRNEGLDSPFFT